MVEVRVARRLECPVLKARGESPLWVIELAGTNERKNLESVVEGKNVVKQYLEMEYIGMLESSLAI
jgi:hypothetical protein